MNSSKVTRDQVLDSRDLITELESRGVKLFGNGNQRTARCPLPGHEDSNPSFSINVSQQVWKCHGCQRGGSVIDFIALMDGRDPNDVYRELAAELEPAEPFKAYEAPPKPPPGPQAEQPWADKQFVCAYSYTDAEGVEVFQVHRFLKKDGKKTFEQWRRDKNGMLIAGMEGVTRVPYRLHEVVKAQEVWLVEGEKDANTLREHGFIATTNPGGSGGWLDSYAVFLEGKDVVYCGDNDTAGAEHLTKVKKSLEGKVKSLRIIPIPPVIRSDGRKVKDVTDWLESGASALEQLHQWLKDAKVMPKGVDLPFWSMGYAMDYYYQQSQNAKNSNLDLCRWLPSFRKSCRPLVPGDLVTLIASTAAGKTAVLQNLIIAMPDIPIALFEMELSMESMFERLIGQKMNITGDAVLNSFQSGIPIGMDVIVERFNNFIGCTKSMSVAGIEEACRRSELILGRPPKLILIDYIQLVGGSGDTRYERFSNIAEDLRKMALNLNAVVFVTCQSKRKESDDREVHLSDGKESGSIENSSSLVLGMWREEMNSGDGVNNKTVIRVLKNSRGPSGAKIECNWNPTFRITELSPIDYND